MNKKLLYLDDVSFIQTDESYNIPAVSEKEKNRFIKKFGKRGWYDGNLIALKEIVRQGKSSKIYCGKSSFYDLAISRLTNLQIFPIISVDAVIEVENSIVIIKRDSNVFDYSNWWDFPAGMVHVGESMESRLFNRINKDTLINPSDVYIKKRIPFSIILDGTSINFFYYVKYLNSKDKINFFLKNKKNKIVLLEKSKISSFLKNKKFIFPEILSDILFRV